MAPDRNPDFQRIVTAYGDSLLRMCYLYLRDIHLAQDAVQETFLRVHMHYASYRGDAAEKTWIVRIAINVCKNTMRTHWWRRVDIGASLLEIPVAAPVEPDDTLLIEIMKLSPRYREVILLYYYQELKIKRNPLRIAIAAVLCLLAALAVMTAAVPEVNAMVEGISPDAASLLRPLRLECEDMGITVKVEGAMHDDTYSVIYITMQDLADRSIEEFFQEYDIVILGEGSDQFTTTAVYSSADDTKNTIGLIMTAEEGDAMNGNKMTVRITSSDGRWETTFKINEVPEVKEKTCDIDIDSLSIKKMRVSPTGVSVTGEGEANFAISALSVIMQDGSEERCHLSSGCTVLAYVDDTGSTLHELTLRYIPCTLLNIDEIQEIVIDDQHISFID